jgi:hypothetical protein
VKGEAVVAGPVNRMPSSPGVIVHMDAQLKPQGRALLMLRVHTEGWQGGDAAAVADLS